MKYEKNQNFENCFFKYKSIIGNNCVFIDTRKILFLFNFSKYIASLVLFLFNNLLIYLDLQSLCKKLLTLNC
jgi:hypothetical protein